MTRFLAVYLGSPESAAVRQWHAMPAAARQERERQGMDAWRQWAKANAAVIVDGGAPIGRTKRADAGGISDTRNMICAYVVVEAESHAAAARLFVDHPHFTVFPGEAVEIMECLPLPAPPPGRG